MRVDKGFDASECFVARGPRVSERGLPKNTPTKPRGPERATPRRIAGRDRAALDAVADSCARDAQGVQRAGPRRPLCLSMGDRAVRLVASRRAFVGSRRGVGHLGCLRTCVEATSALI